MLKRILWICVFCGLVNLGARYARADLQVNVRVDKVILNDGTEIPCIVLIVTQKSVLIVESDPDDPTKARQRVVAANTVAKIVRGEAVGEMTGFQTEKELLQKVIQGSGFRKDEFSKDLRNKLSPQGPKGNDQVKEGKAARVAVAAASLLPSTGKMGARELTDAYLSRFPTLRTAAQNLIGLDQAAQLMDQARKGDPIIRKQVENFIRLVLNSSPSMLDEKDAAAASRPAQPMVLDPNNLVGPPAPKAQQPQNQPQN